MAGIPTEEGFYWAKWKIAKEGTDHCPKCNCAYSEWEKPNVIATVGWEVVLLVHNGGFAGNPEEWKVEVTGVSTWQDPDGFFWGEKVERHGA